jgi:hypothetical protein
MLGPSVPRAQHLLFRLWEHERKRALSPAAARQVHRRQKVPFENTFVPERDHCSWAMQMVKDRGSTRSGADDDAQLHKKLQVPPKPSSPSAVDQHTNPLPATSRSTLKPTRTTSSAPSTNGTNPRLPALVRGLFANLQRAPLAGAPARRRQELAFCITDIGHGWASPLWLRLGRNLSSLADLLGVAADR